MKILLKNLFFIIPLIFILSCGEEDGATSFQSNSNVPLKITVNTSEEDVSQTQDLTTAQGVEECLPFVDTVSVVVQGDFPTISEQFSIGEDIVVVIPFDPDGANTVTIIVALLNNGQACCSGQATFNLNPNAANEVTIDCEKVDEICNDNSDNNGNELVDCEEEDCTGSLCDGTNINICIEGECVEPAPPITSEVDLCTDGIDNDEDEGEVNGGTDCTDLDCAFDPACAEICDNEVDDPDADGEDNADCLDDACDGEPCNAEDEAFICVDNECIDPTDIETDCDNGVSDDTDELVDCDDPDCEGMICFDGDDGSACVEGACAEVACADDENNDGDLIFGEVPAIDCDDIDCDGQACGIGVGAVCDHNDSDNPCVEIFCFDTEFDGEVDVDIDNDEDESANCADPDCNNMPCGTGSAGAGATCLEEDGPSFFTCQEIACGNDEDDDRDFDEDCDDTDCFNQPCGDGVGATCRDNFQGFQPSLNRDSQTANFSPIECREDICNDGIDNDEDEQFEDEFPTAGTDCEDVDCDGEVGEQGGSGICQFDFEFTCNDGFDNDGDGLIDCEDEDCGNDGEVGGDCTINGSPFSAECEFNDTDECDEVDCTDGIDNDGNEGIDCADPDCEFDQNCQQ